MWTVTFLHTYFNFAYYLQPLIVKINRSRFYPYSLIVLANSVSIYVYLCLNMLASNIGYIVIRSIGINHESIFDHINVTIVNGPHNG